MPYSKNPHKYPPEMGQLIEVLGHRSEPLRLPCADAKDAAGRKVQIQSYFKAVELYTAELELSLLRLKARAEAGKKPEMMQAAREHQAVLEVWEGRMMVARRWSVRTLQLGAGQVGLEISQREVKGVFGDALRAVIAAPVVKVELSEDFLQDQFALLRQATLALERTGGKSGDETV